MTRTESQIQAAIVRMLRTAEFRVMTTSQPLQRGRSGVSKGIPDVLCWHDSSPGKCLCLEVKKPKAKVRPEQKESAERGDIFIVYNEGEAAAKALDFIGSESGLSAQVLKGFADELGRDAA